MNRIFLGMNSEIASLLRVVDAYSAATGLSESRVSTLVFKGGGRVGQLRAGADIGVKIRARALEWFSSNWPAGTEWPTPPARPLSSGSHDDVSAPVVAPAAGETGLVGSSCEVAGEASFSEGSP